MAPKSSAFKKPGRILGSATTPDPAHPHPAEDGSEKDMNLQDHLRTARLVALSQTGNYQIGSEIIHTLSDVKIKVMEAKKTGFVGVCSSSFASPCPPQVFEMTNLN